MYNLTVHVYIFFLTMQSPGEAKTEENGKRRTREEGTG